MAVSLWVVWSIWFTVYGAVVSAAEEFTWTFLNVAGFEAPPERCRGAAAATGVRGFWPNRRSSDAAICTTASAGEVSRSPDGESRIFFAASRTVGALAGAGTARPLVVMRPARSARTTASEANATDRCCSTSSLLMRLRLRLRRRGKTGGPQRSQRRARALVIARRVLSGVEPEESLSTP